MDRYSLIWGKDSKGFNTSLGASKRLGKFINGLGAVEAEPILIETLTLLGSFKPLPGYDTQPADEQPLTWQYAPMYISKRPKMPKNVAPFAAFCISGAENRDGAQGTEAARSSHFSHLFFLSRECMLQQIDGYSFYDQLFGGKLTNWIDIREHREGRQFVDFNAVPDKLNADAIPSVDRALGAAIAAELFGKGEEKDNIVVVRLEKGRTFNTRAREILQAVYSLLPARMACETGFSAYLEPDKIADLNRQMSINLFILPAECGLEKLGSGCKIFDISDGIHMESLPTSELSEKLLQMCALPFSDRFAVYSALFPESDANFFKADNYLKKCSDFTDEYQRFMDWYKNAPEQFDTVESVQSAAEAFPYCLFVADCKKRFLEKLTPEQLKDLKTSALTDTLLSYETDKTAFKKNLARYEFIKRFSSADVGGAAGAKIIAVKNTQRADALKELEEQKKQELTTALQRQENEARNRVEQLEQHHKAELAQAKEKLSKRERELEKCTSELENAKTTIDGLHDKNKLLSEENTRLCHKINAAHGNGNKWITLAGGFLIGLVSTLALFFILHGAGVIWAEPEVVETNAPTSEKVAPTQNPTQQMVPTTVPEPVQEPEITENPDTVDFTELESEETRQTIMQAIPEITEISTEIGNPLPDYLTEDGFVAVASFILDNHLATENEPTPDTAQTAGEEPAATPDGEQETLDNQGEDSQQSAVENDQEQNTVEKMPQILLFKKETETEGEEAIYRYVAFGQESVSAALKLREMTNESFSALLFYAYEENNESFLNLDELFSVQHYSPEGLEVTCSQQYGNSISDADYVIGVVIGEDQVENVFAFSSPDECHTWLEQQPDKSGLSQNGRFIISAESLNPTSENG